MNSWQSQCDLHDRGDHVVALEHEVGLDQCWCSSPPVRSVLGAVLFSLKVAVQVQSELEWIIMEEHSGLRQRWDGGRGCCKDVSNVQETHGNQVLNSRPDWCDLVDARTAAL